MYLCSATIYTLMKIELKQPRSLVHYPRKGVMVATEPRGFDFSNYEETIHHPHRNESSAGSSVAYPLG